MIRGCVRHVPVRGLPLPLHATELLAPSTKAAQIRSRTPSSIHRWKARWTLESSGNSLGRRFHWQPVRKRKMTASKTARWSTLGRPVFFGGSCSLRIGSIFSHSSSGTRQIVGMGFSSGERSTIGASYSQGLPPMIPDREGFEIVSK